MVNAKNKFFLCIPASAGDAAAIKSSRNKTKPNRTTAFLKGPASFYSENFKFFKNALGQFIPKCSSKHVITSTK